LKEYFLGQLKLYRLINDHGIRLTKLETKISTAISITIFIVSVVNALFFALKILYGLG
jgi:hypothetical protein